jgi:predicted permease
MLETFIATLQPMLVMFTCILIGFVLRKAKLTPENTGTVLSKVENYVFMPAQVAVTFMTYCTVASLSANYRYCLYSILCIAVSMLLGVPLSNLFSRDGKNRGVYRYALVFANFGFLGNTLVPQMLGQEYLYPYLLFTLPVNFWAYLWGMNQMVPADGEKVNPFKRLLNPVIIGLFTGAVLGLTGLARLLPNFVISTMNSLSGCMGPTAMILTGFIVGGYDLKEMLGNKKVYLMTFLRVTILPAIILAVLWLCGGDLQVMTMALVAFGAALGMNTVVIPAAYGRDTKPGAAMTMVSHLCAVISIPLMYALLTALMEG